MKTLLLLRHAKAENGAPGSPDTNRALNEQGRQEAQAIGRLIKKKNLKIELVLCSTAVRARETTALLLAAAEVTMGVHYDERIYEASPAQLLQVISEIDEHVTVALLVGHNPGMEELLGSLTAQSPPMGTCTLAKIDLANGDWGRLTNAGGSLDWVLRGRDFLI